MGRNMFGPVRGEWTSYEGDWRGWWGEEPPYHAPVFVLTHHPHEPIEMAGGTTFHFVTGGFDEAMARAREARQRRRRRGRRGVGRAAGPRQRRAATSSASTSSRSCSARVSGSSTAASTCALQILEAEHSPWATHVRYAVGRPGDAD